MKNSTIRTSSILLLALLLVTQTMGQDIPKPMSPPRLVNDFAGLLTSQENSLLEQKLLEFNNQTTTQIAVVIVNSLEGYDRAAFAYEIGEQWKIGQKGSNNGIVVLVKPRTQESKGEAFIAPGYSLEPIVTDIVSKRIIENEMIPHFREGKYYAGIDAAVNTLMSLTKNEFTSDQYLTKTQQVEKQPIAPFAIFIFLIVLFSILSAIGRSNKKKYYTAGRNLPFWMLLGSMLAGSGSSRGGGFGGFSSGSGSFGGFGGGSFGGGGAGGSW